MASKQSQKLSSVSKAEKLSRQVEQYRTDLDKAINIEVDRIIRENECFFSAFPFMSANREMILKSLMEFAADASNVDEFADVIGDIATNVPDLGALNSTINTIAHGEQFQEFVMSLLGAFKENLEEWDGHNKKRYTGDELIREICQLVADYVVDLAVDFVWDRVINEEDDDVET